MSKTNFTKEGVFMYYNTQEEIITKITKSLEESLILRKKVKKKFSKYNFRNDIGKVNSSIKNSRKYKGRL